MHNRTHDALIAVAILCRLQCTNVINAHFFFFINEGAFIPFLQKAGYTFKIFKIKYGISDLSLLVLQI